MRFCSLLAGQANLNQLKSVSELSLPITNHAYLAAVAALISVSLHDHRLTNHDTELHLPKSHHSKPACPSFRTRIRLGEGRLQANKMTLIVILDFIIASDM